MTDYATIEALASRLCHDAGRNWYAKGCKRNHWRKKAGEQLQLQATMKQSFISVFKKLTARAK